MQDGPSLSTPACGRLDRLLAAGSLCLSHVHALADALVVVGDRGHLPPRAATLSELRSHVEQLGNSLRSTALLWHECKRVETVLSLLTAELAARSALITDRSAPIAAMAANGGAEAFDCFDPSPQLCNWMALDSGVQPILRRKTDGLDSDPYMRLAAPLCELHLAGRADLANALMNRVLEARRDYTIAPLLPLYIALRAAALAPSRSNHHDVLDFACTLLSEPRQTRLIAIGGLSGSGKSVLARALAILLAPPPGAIWLRTDGIRKRLLGYRPEDRLSEEGYRPAISGRVYRRLAEDTRLLLNLGQTVIAEATFTRAPSRAAIAAIATGADCLFHGIWLDAPLEVLKARADARASTPHLTGGSDASSRIVEAQSRDKFGNITWHRIGTDRPFDAVLLDALSILRP